MDSTTDIYADFIDMSAALEFQRMFYSKFENSRVDLYSGTFQCCLNKVVEKRKPLLFILHNEEVRSSCAYWELLPAFESILCEHFIILGWKINSRGHYSEHLSDRILVVEELSTYLRNNAAGIFAIVPEGNSVKVYDSINISDGDVVDNATDRDKLKKLLDMTVKLMSMYINQDFFKDMTSVKYQQWMYEELGDRDYDSFEPNEHELLKEKILFALYGPPKVLEDDTIGYENKQTEEMEKLYEKIREKNNEYSRWTDRIVIAFIYVCTEPSASEQAAKKQQDEKYKPEADFLPVPVFVIRKCKTDKLKRRNKHGCRIFIDNICRVYDSWDKYLVNNKLPPCKMVYPKDGRYCGDKNDMVCLGDAVSPSCSGMSQFLRGTDIGAGIVGFASGAALVASSFTPLGIVTIPAIIGGVASGIYSAGRSTSVLVDRSTHEESISITNAESRGAYLSIGASAFCVIGAGATKVLSSAVQSGANVGRGIQHTVTAINGVNVFVAGAATANGFYDVYQQYTEDAQLPSALTILQLGSSLFFFGNSVYNFRTGAAMVREIQTNTLSEIEANLRSNRHRKTFNKIMKETMRVNGETRGRAEVISTMRNAGSRDDVLAVLTRSNKNFNKQGVRFSAEGGGISLNGVKVNIIEYGNMAKVDQGVHLGSLPSIPETHSQASITRTGNLVRGMKLKPNLGAIAFDPRILMGALAAFAEDLQPKVIKICEKFMNQVDVDLITALRELLGDVQLEIMQFVIRCINSYALEYRRNFQERILTENVTEVCRNFGFRNPHVTLNDFLTYVIQSLTNNEMMDQLMNDFLSWYTSLLYKAGEKRERIERRREYTAEERRRKNCDQCGGYYYT